MMRKAAALIVLSVTPLALLLSAPPAAAQAELDVKLIDMPMWVGPDSLLRLTLQVTNRGQEPATNLRATIAIHEGITTRSQLERTFTGSFGPTVGSDTVLIEGEIAPEETRTVTVEKQLSEFQAFRARPVDRPHPLRITVRPGAGAPATIDSHMVFFSQPVPIPLLVSLIIPLHVPAQIYRPDLSVSRTVTRTNESVVQGPMNAILSALEQRADVPVTVAPSGLFLDLMEDLANGYRITGDGDPVVVPAEDPSASAAAAAIARMSAITSHPSTMVISTPYSHAFLPALGEARAQSQVGQTRSRLSTLLGREPANGWFLPMPQVLDEPTLAGLQDAGISKVILGSDATTPGSGRPRTPVLTRASPVQVATRGAESLEALIADNGLAARLGDLENGTVEARQRFLAETATILLERPAQKRVVVAVAPADWGTDSVFISGILDALASSPWMRGTTPDNALREVEEREPAVPLVPDEVRRRAEIPGADYFQALGAARRSINQFEGVDPPNDIKGRLERRLLIAESADWWGSRGEEDQGKSFSRAVTQRVAEEFSKVKPPAELAITLTSTTGTIPITITSEADYEMRVVIRLDSEKLQFPDAADCPGSSTGRCIQATIKPQSQDIRVRTLAAATGTFPLRVSIQAPDGTRMASSLMRIRSTAYNRVALGITGGSAAFLAFWWVASTVRRRIP